MELGQDTPSGCATEDLRGRASGPEPLDQLFRYTVDKFKEAAGRRLDSFECHSIMCKIGEIVVVGGARRNAMISLSNLQDDKMRTAKSGNWWEHRPEMALANNSVVYTKTPDMEAFMREWVALVESKSGERGIFSRVAAQAHVKRTDGENTTTSLGATHALKSCCVLISSATCLVVVRATDTPQTLKKRSNCNNHWDGAVDVYLHALPASRLEQKHR